MICRNLLYFTVLWALIGGGAAAAENGAGVAIETAPLAVSKADAVELVLAGQPGFRQAGYYVALWRGYFAEEGVAVAVRSLRTGESAVETVLTQPGVYAVGGDEFIAARVQENPVVLVAAIQQETAQALEVREPIEAGWLPELRGRRIGLKPAVYSAPLRTMLGQMGTGPSAAEWVELDGLTALPPNLVAEQSTVFGLEGNLLRPADHGVVLFYGDCVYASQSELAYHPKRMAGLRRAVLRGWESALTEVTGTIDLLQMHAAEIGLERTREELGAEAEVARGLIKPSAVELGHVDAVRVGEIAQALRDLGVVSRVGNLEDFIYRPSFTGLPRWVYGIGAGLVVATLVALAVMGFNVRLQRKVTERTRELAESQERYREMFEHAPVGIVEADFSEVVSWIEARRSEGVTDLGEWLDEHPEEIARQFANVRTLRGNNAALAMVGVTDVESYTRCWAAGENLSLTRAFREEMLAIWRGELDVQVDLRFMRSNGTMGDGWLKWTVPIVGRRPDFGRVLVVVTEVTELRAAEMRMRESEERHRTLFESAIEGVYESTPNDGLLSVNPAFARMLGFDRPYALLEWTREHGPGHVYVDTDRRQIFLEALGNGESLFDFESEARCADGSQKWISENVRAVRAADGTLLRLQGFVSDISERKRFEQVLAQERERLAVTLRAMTEGVITTDDRGVVKFINEAAEQLTGWIDGSAIGRRLAEVCMLRHERTRADLPIPFDDAMESATVVDLPRSTVLVHRTGSPHLVEGRCAPIHDSRSRPVGVVLVLRDVTEKLRHEAEMLRTTKLESLGVLAGGIAHDFNNLLTVVLGNLHLVSYRSGDMPDIAHWIHDAESAAEKARGLTQQLLTFAKGGNPIKSAVRLPEVVKEAAAFALHGSTVRSEMDVAADLWSADVDRGQVGQVVQNLVLNAVQAMPEGGIVTLRLRNEKHPGNPLRSIAAGNYVSLEVEDRGHGIAPENLGRIFDPYFTTKETGSGLGLATVYSVVTKHAGHVEVTSEPASGTKFRILLPALPEVRSASVRNQSPNTRKLRGRVLFMDDEENLRRMARHLLEHLGLQVVTVGDGAALVQQYFEAKETGQCFDVVVMDLTIPGGMGGKEAMEQLRRMDPTVRAVVSSGYSIDPVIANFREFGFCARVSKPYRPADLAHVLGEVLDGHSPAPVGG